MSDPNKPDETSMVRPDRNETTVEKVGFGVHETALVRETQGAALAARAQAEVQARYIMAERKPRHLGQVRYRLLEHCKRSGFAVRAEYAKPVGGDFIRGPSIRFVELALQEYGNVLPEETITYDDDHKRVTRVSVTDLERNVTYYGDVMTEKTVERKKPKAGDEVLGSRQNSYGDTVFKIRATEDDFSNKNAAACSKKLRNLGIRILPADIVDEAMHTCRITRETEDAEDPKAARRKLYDGFAALGVQPAAVDAYLGHALEASTPAELDSLRAAYAAIRDGEARWLDLVEAQKGERGEVEKVSKPAEAAGAKVKDKLAALREKTRKGNGTNGAEVAKPADGVMTDTEKLEAERIERGAQ